VYQKAIFVTLRALEFYSGIGAFAQAASLMDIEVAAAFDQSRWANLAYQANYGHKPSERNLDSVPASAVPAGDLWWMSPPCTPFSRRGKQKDDADPRARSFLHLINMIGAKTPRHILIENVQGFIGSTVHAHLLETLKAAGYATAEYSLCPTMFGVPMLRPRVFIVASQDALTEPIVAPSKIEGGDLERYLFAEGETFACNPEMLRRYGAVLNIVDPSVFGSYLICFTSGYHRCRQASGSLISTGDGTARFVSPDEILRLLGFRRDFKMPDTISLEVAYRLVGNSVDVRAIAYLLKEVLRFK
jgi:DNA (cytosine-5)-methyltransferase 1